MATPPRAASGGPKSKTATVAPAPIPPPPRQKTVRALAAEAKHRLPTWKMAAACSINLVIATSCVCLLIDAAGSSHVLPHSVFQLSLVIISNLSWCAVVVSVPRRQVFLLGIVCPVNQLVIALDTVWKCRAIHFIYKLLGPSIILDCRSWNCVYSL